MKNIIGALCLLLVASAFVFAQTDDYKKAEFFVGYSNGQVDTGIDTDNLPAGVDIDKRENFNGFEASGVYNFSRYVGAKADVSGTYSNKNFSFSDTTGGVNTSVSLDSKNSLYNILGGIQIKDNSTETRVKPFAHALVGAGIARTKVNNFRCTTSAIGGCPVTVDDFDVSETGIAGAFGGGLDIKVSNRIDIRAIQFDYNPVRINDQTLNNFRIGVGVVFR